MKAATATILRLPSQPAVKLDDGPATIGLVQREIIRSRMPFGELATLSGVCTNTIGRIAYGDTKRPQMRTCMLILVALGWEVWASERAR